MLFGVGLARRVRRPHLPAGARAAALRDPRGARARAGRRRRAAPAAKTSRVAALTRVRDRGRSHDARRRLRLSQRRRALPARAARARRRRAARRDARRRSRRRRTGSSASPTSPTISACPGSRPATPMRRTSSARVAALAPDFLFSFYYRRMLKPPLLALAARAARSTCTARCCRAIAAARRSTGRCCTASAEPARRCTTWPTSPTPATSSRSRRCRSCPTTPRAKCSTR